MTPYITSADFCLMTKMLGIAVLLIAWAITEIYQLLTIILVAEKELTDGAVPLEVSLPTCAMGFQSHGSLSATSPSDIALGLRESVNRVHWPLPHLD